MDLNTSSPMKDIPIYDQDGTGLCYAYVASQLLEFKLKSVGHKETPSVIDLSVKSAGYFQSQVKGGRVEDVLDTVASEGFVDKACTDKQIKAFAKDGNVTTEQYTRLLNEMHKRTSYIPSYKDEVGAIKTFSKTDEYLGNCHITPMLDDLNKKGLWGDSVVEILKLALNPCDSKRKKAPAFKYEKVDYGSDKTLQDKLDLVLDGNSPAELSICSEFVVDPSHKGLRGQSPPLPRNMYTNISECSGHSLLATGRRVEAGRCQYLIRNSWGSTWQTPKTVCACRTSKKYYEVCPNFEELKKKATNPKSIAELSSEASNRVIVGCWMDGLDLMKNTFHVGGLK